jgi:hypothetical protein
MGKRNNKTKHNRITSSSSLVSQSSLPSEPQQQQQQQPLASFESLPEALHSLIAPYLKRDKSPYASPYNIGALNLIATARWLGQYYNSCLTILAPTASHGLKCQHPALLSLLLRLPALEKLSLHSPDHKGLTTVAAALHAGACASVSSLLVRVKEGTTEGVMEILGALGTGSCPSLHRLDIWGLDPRFNNITLGAAEVEEIVLALAETLEERQERGCDGIRSLDLPQLWSGKYGEASSRIISVIAPTIEGAGNPESDAEEWWDPDVFEAFSAAVAEHPGSLRLKELFFVPDCEEYDVEDFEFLPIAQAMKEGKTPHLEILDLSFFALRGEILDCMIKAIEEGNLSLLRELCLTGMDLDGDDLARLFQALGVATQHTQHVTELRFQTYEDLETDMLGTQVGQALGWALQQCNACPELEKLTLDQWDLGGVEGIGMTALLGTSLATPRLYKKLGTLHLVNCSLTPKTMKLLAQFMASGGFPDLQELYLQLNPAISNEGLHHLVTGLKSYHSQSLVDINLSKCGVDAEGVRFFAQASVEGFPNTLEVVHFYCSGLSDKVKKECRELMKEHRVYLAFDNWDVLM